MESIKENMADFSRCIEGAIQVLDRYETSRPGSLAFTKLEEAVLWAQVMAMNVNVKKQEDTDVDKDKISDAA